jgi:hypothetical protein
MLYFNDLTAFREARNFINSMTSDKIRTHEEINGYKSFGRICDELYSNTDPEEFRSIEEIKTFVALNSDYFQLIEEENGNLTFEKVLFKNPNRYLLNKDRMYKINRTVYKEFEDFTISTDEGNTDLLKSINQSSIITYENNPDFRFIYPASTKISSESTSAKDLPPVPNPTCGTSF